MADVRGKRGGSRFTHGLDEGVPHAPESAREDREPMTYDEALMNVRQVEGRDEARDVASSQTAGDTNMDRGRTAWTAAMRRGAGGRAASVLGAEPEYDYDDVVEQSFPASDPPPLP